MDKKVIFSLFICIMMISLVSGIPPFSSQDTTAGFEISNPAQTHLKLNEKHTFSIHVLNKTNGIPLVTGLQCELHIENKTGEHVYTGLVYSDGDFDYDFDVNQNNFTVAGEYTYLVGCNTSYAGGFSEGGFVVNKAGDELTLPITIYYGILLCILLFVFLLLLIGTIVIPWKDHVNDKGDLISINDAKYFKVLSGYLSYVMMMVILWFIDEISTGYLLYDFLGNLISLVRVFSFAILWPLSLFLLASLIFNWMRDRKVTQLVKRGIMLEK